MRQAVRIVAFVALVSAPVGGGAVFAQAAPPLIVTARPAPVPPAQGGTISIEPRPGEGVDDAAMHRIVDAVSQALTARGFTVFEDSGHAASTLDLLVERADVGMARARAAGQRSPSIAGTGLAVALGTGESEQVALRRTRLEMRFHRRGVAAAVWDGAAVTVREAGTAKGSDATVAADLSRALLDAYPNPPQEELGVP